MSHVGHLQPKLQEFAGIKIPMGGVNVATVKDTWQVMILLTILSFFATRHMKKVPGRLQLAFEIFVQAFDKLASDTLGARGRSFTPLIITFFLMILFCNWSTIIPIPGVEEPTRDINTTLAFAILSFVISHTAAIRYKGFKHYVLEYFEPMIEINGKKIPNFIIMPLHVIGEFGKLVSHSFRLFGNILGGSIIVQVVSSLVNYIVLPIGLNFFFNIFIGCIQAVVFSILALTYIAILIQTPEQEHESHSH